MELKTKISQQTLMRQDTNKKLKLPTRCVLKTFTRNTDTGIATSRAPQKTYIHNTHFLGQFKNKNIYIYILKDIRAKAPFLLLLLQPKQKNNQKLAKLRASLTKSPRRNPETLKTKHNHIPDMQMIAIYNMRYIEYMCVQFISRPKDSVTKSKVYL